MSSQPTRQEISFNQGSSFNERFNKIIISWWYKETAVIQWAFQDFSSLSYDESMEAMFVNGQNLHTLR